MDIAIIGFAFKLPQDVEDPASLWATLEAGKNLATEWPKSRVNNAFFDANTLKQGRLHSRLGHFLTQDPAAFDAPFFHLTASEAAAMDPVQRLTLETAYHAFENAGIQTNRLQGSRTAVFGASASGEYERMTAKDPDNATRTAMLGNAMSLIPNRISWYFDLCGPSVFVGTACSSSLVSLHLACQSLQTGDASMALVVGANLMISPESAQYQTSLGFLSPDGVCHSFDRGANGFSKGEIVAGLVLKPVADAVREKDVIRAVIRATGYNHDGRTATVTQTSAQAQEQLVRHVYHQAGLGMSSTRYVEAHGTGTIVGDSNEVAALSSVFKESRTPQEPLYV
ncbi:hypothetical protein CDD80_7147 [Ophiocordyceps camponoti-rufipedis]|uniref:Ketosynthase family 3 (KS3) domain-containing protein n=1 Tax=Ophiocordyceps camponoti-rufipedis TaxID=2004952 RepID=A0A2C5ZFR7_9HYPO|nr:hypothetical protein CDD80_7147 [Ophiocordyceps camponoti-rufipedis]